MVDHIDYNAGALRRRGDLFIDADRVGGRDHERGALHIAINEVALSGGDLSGCGQALQFFTQMRRDDFDRGTRSQQQSEFPFGDVTAAHDHTTASAQAKKNRQEIHDKNRGSTRL